MPDGTEGDNPGAALDTARAFVTGAEGAYRDATNSVAEETRATVSQAEADYYGAVDALKGQAANVIDAAGKPVYAYVDKKNREAEKALTSLYQDLYAAGAEPHVYAGAVAADIAADDIYQSAMDQMLKPVIGKTMPEVIPAPDMSAPNGGCPDGYVFDGRISACRLFGSADLPADGGPGDIVVSPPTVPAPIPVPMPPADGVCPAPVIQLPACPPPVINVTVAPSPSEGDEDEYEDYQPEEEEEEEDTETETAPPPRPVDEKPPPEKPKKEPKGAPPLPYTIPDGDFQGEMPQWDGPERCAVLMRQAGQTIQGATIIADKAVKERLRQAIIDDLQLQTEWRNANPDRPPEESGKLTPNQDRVKKERDELAAKIVRESQTESAPDPVAYAAIGADRLEERALGTPATYCGTGWWYDLRWSSPQFLPDQEEVDAALLKGVIDTKLWECLTRANGNKLWGRRFVIDSKRTKPDLYSIITLYRRGLITKDGLWARARQLGVLNDDELEQFVRSTDYIPTASDLVRFMVRDVDDPQSVAAGGLDTDFGLKFQGFTAAMAQAQGIDRETMLRIWRAHWHLPSFTQIKEMVHRLRPGRVPEEFEFTLADARQVMKQDDMSPGYIDRMLTTSYHPITRTDIKAFYADGAIGPEEVRESLQDIGYSPADAIRIQRAWSLAVANTQQNRARLWTRNNVVKVYIAGEITRDTADALLARTVASAAERAALLDDADMMRSVQTRRKCIKATRKRRLMGELSEMDSRRELQRLGVDPLPAATIAEGWTCELQTAQREPTVAQIIGWMQHGYIDPNEAFRRLRNLRYTPEDAQRIMQKGIDDEAARRAKLAAEEARRQQAAAEKAERTAAARRKEQQQQQRQQQQAAGGAGKK